MTTRKLTIARADVAHAQGRDAQTGKFTEGNTGTAQLRLLDMDPSEAAPWVRPSLERAQRRFRGAKTSGLYKRAGSRVDGMLRAAVMADCMHEALSAHAVTLTRVGEAREVMADASRHAREARVTWLKLFALCGLKRGPSDGMDPLARLASELSEVVDHDE